MISALLGVAEEDLAWFRSVATDLTIALEGITGEARLAVADAAMDELGAYFTDLVADRRRNPKDDVAGLLVDAHDSDGDRLSRDELVGNMMLMLTAGFETTTFLLGYALLLAFEHGPLDRLREEPGFARGFTEAQGGTTVPAGTKIVLMLGAGNRDPRWFFRPERFDPDRPDVQPLSFGAGPHFCLGAPLSRLEAEIALPRLLRRFPRLAPAGPAVRRDTWVGRGLSRLPLTTG